MSAPTVIDPAELPAPVRGYLAAHTARDVDTALAAFTPDAVVTDEGHTHRGTEEVRRWLAEAGTAFTFTTELVGARRVDATRWIAVQRLEGDFPGGVAELQYRFTMAGDLVAELVIAP
ncbi:nuclear transport factor 2 family protein [Geodermatophilus sp. SYSU D01106]